MLLLITESIQKCSDVIVGGDGFVRTHAFTIRLSSEVRYYHTHPLTGAIVDITAMKVYDGSMPERPSLTGSAYPPVTTEQLLAQLATERENALRWKPPEDPPYYPFRDPIETKAAQALRAETEAAFQMEFEANTLAPVIELEVRRETAADMIARLIELRRAQ